MLSRLSCVNASNTTQETLMGQLKKTKVGALALTSIAALFALAGAGGRQGQEGPGEGREG